MLETPLFLSLLTATEAVGDTLLAVVAVAAAAATATATVLRGTREPLLLPPLSGATIELFAVGTTLVEVARRGRGRLDEEERRRLKAADRNEEEVGGVIELLPRWTSGCCCCWGGSALLPIAAVAKENPFPVVAAADGVIVIGAVGGADKLVGANIWGEARLPLTLPPAPT